MTEEKKEIREKHKLVCIGTREFTVEAKKGKTKTVLAPVFYEVLEGNKLDENELGWTGVKASPGNVYTVEASIWEKGGKHIIFIPKDGRMEWVGHWHDIEQRAKWQAEAKALTDYRTKLRMRENAERHNDVKDFCKPLQAVYHKLPYSQRTAFLIAVQELITKPPSAKEVVSDHE